ncbi:MAG: nucleic acid-binding protein [Candidatus Methanoplasma sp.]|jgi:UPF0271 protein|nr:nucleic acid-binding protein [Candidatus Methanoplasma sp.]
MLILDSSALFSMEGLPDEEFMCPPGVVDELARHKDGRLVLWGDLLRISDCTKESIIKVKDAARKSGDLGRLSDVDIAVLALAADTGGTILSDDYSIQNVSKIMGMPFRSVGTKGITKTEKWNYRCVGCGKWFKERPDECPICGSGMKACRKK